MNKSFSIKFLAAAMFCLLLGIAPIFAQSQGSTGSITGVISDSTGAVVPNATVTLTSLGTNQTQTVTTSDDGIYRFVLLQPGRYSVKTSAASFAEQSLEVEVQVGRTTDANFTLGAGNVAAEVEVTAEGVQTTTSNFDAVQNETAIQTLPINGRRFQDFVTLTPSAQVDPSRGQISLSGQRGINTNVNVDGVDYNQPFFGGIRGGERSNAAFTIPQESIREFQVVAAGYSAEFGRSSGGIVNAVTKAGTNEFRGTAFYLLRPRQLAKANKYADALKEQSLGPRGIDATLAPTQHQFGGSVGGPIAKDKLFFFGSYEQQRFRAPRQVLFPTLTNIDPAALNAGQRTIYDYYRSIEDPYTQTNDAYAALGRIDWNVNDANRFNVRYSYSQNTALNAVSTGESALDPTTSRALSNNGTEKNKNNIVVAQFVSNFTPTVVNELKFQFAKEDRPRIANDLAANVDNAIGSFGTRNFLPTTQNDRRIQFVDGLTWIKGNHSFKFGGEFSHIYAEQEFGFNQFGTYTFSGLTGATQLLEAQSTNQNLTPTNPTSRVFGRFDVAAARYRQQIGNLQAGFAVQEIAAFAQDSWRVTPKLTLNYGLRFEKQLNPEAEANNNPVIDLIRNAPLPLYGGNKIDPTEIPDSQNEWGPRVGFAYDPAGDGKTVIRGFAGMYYARTPLLVLAAPFNNFRDPAGDLSVELGPGAFNSQGFSQAAFEAANPQYVAIVGTGVTPNTVYRQFAILGINLNNVAFDAFPTLTTEQLGTIAGRLRAARTNPAASLGVFENAAFIGISDNFKNPQSFQFGGGIEHQVFDGVVVGLDYSQVNTVYLQRNRDINLPVPTGVDAATGRVLVNRNLTGALARPFPNLASVQIRDSSARSLYQGLTFRVNINKKWARINAFYTLSKNQSNDDNERDSGGVLYSNPYDLSGEYGLSRIDRRHQFVANPVFFLPYGFEISSAIRLRSGTPVNSTVGTDINGDGNNTERPILVPGYELPRNAFRNRNIYDVDLRVQKGFSFGERTRLILSSEFFNVFNFSNIQLSSFTSTNYCATSNARCGLDGITNFNFLQVREQRPGNVNFGKIIVANNPGSQVFQMQLGARFQF
jgi:hypothetical protein